MKKCHTATVKPQGVEGNTKTSTPPPASSDKSRGWCWTLNNYTEEEYESMKQWCATVPQQYVIGKECGKQGTPHLQGYVYKKETLRFSALKKVCERAHWEKAKGNPKQNYEYCTKEGDYIAGGWEDKSLKVQIKNRLKSKYEGVVWKEWQKQVIEKIETVPDSRTINWVFDPVGNSGKSFLAKYLVLHHEVIIADGKKDNVFNQVLKRLNEDEKEFKIVILDIPRSSEGYMNYGVLEQLKNGLIYSGKYEGGTCVFDDVHVFVFANFEPDKSQFSEDRWCVWEI